MPTAATSVVLVHGAFADGSAWARVIPLLHAQGLEAVAVQNPLTSLEEDMAHVQRAIDRVKVRWVDRALRITPVPRRANDPLRLETWGAARKAGLLAELAGVPVEIVGPGGVVSSED